MSEKPILMTAENYLKCADGTKTQTRRIIGLDADWASFPNMESRLSNEGILQFRCPPENVIWRDMFWGNNRGPKSRHCKPIKPRYKVGDLLYVKESLSKTIDGMIVYGNTEELYLEFSPLAASDLPVRWKWKRDYLSSMFMPKKFARLWLEVAAVRVERLHEISEEDVTGEGIAPFPNHPKIPYMQFATLWDSINGKKHPWESNPWVWVYTFNRIERQDND